MIRNLIIFIFSILVCGLALAQTSGGGPFTHGPTISVTDGVNTCYPYQLKVGTNSCANGIATISGGGSSQWTGPQADGSIYYNGNVGIGTIGNPSNKLTVTASGAATGVTINQKHSGQGGCDASAILLSHFDSDVNDSNCGGSGVKSGTAAGGAAVSATGPKFGAGSLNIPLNGYVTYPYDAGWNFLATNFTVEGWLKTTTAGFQFIENYGNASVAGSAWSIYIDAGNHLNGIAYVGGSSDVVTGTTDVHTGAWFHYAFVRNGATLTLYINGTSEGTPFNIGASSLNSVTPRVLDLGIRTADSAGPFTGNLDEVRISSTARYTGNFTVNTVPFDNSYTYDIPSLQFQSSGTQTASMFTDGSNNNQLTFNVPSSTRMVITPTGNVGINSLAPGNTLDVAGPLRVTGTNQVRFGDDNSASIGASAIGATPAITFDTNSTERMRIDANGNVGIGTTITGGAALSVMNGNVGIGTWVPAGLLDVNRILTVLPGGFVGIGGATSTSSALELNMSGNYQLMLNNGATGGGYWEIGQTDNTFTSGGGKLVFVPNSTVSANATVVFNDTGNVGIGTITPGQRLDVGGTVRALNFINQSGSALVGSQWATQNTTDVSLAGGNVGVGTTITGGSALSVMNGNVGIGTWVPSALFNVGSGTTHYFTVDSSGNVYTTNSISAGGSGLGKLSVTSSGYARGIDISNSNNNSGTSYGAFISKTGADVNGVGIYATATGATNNYAAIFDQGNVGIGTVTPSAKFQVNNPVNGSVFQVDTNGNVGIGTTLTTTAALSVMNGNVGIGTWKPEGKIVVMGGNAGIGTLTPGQALDVAGTIRSVISGLSGAGKAVCWTTDGSLGHCTAGATIVTDGGCTCAK
jgi:hypothetical protein